MRFDLFQLMLSLWFFSIGFFLLKRANRALAPHRSSSVVHTRSSKLTCVAAENYRTTGL
jgi:hypothetical protein